MLPGTSVATLASRPNDIDPPSTGVPACCGWFMSAGENNVCATGAVVVSVWFVVLLDELLQDAIAIAPRSANATNPAAPVPRRVLLVIGSPPGRGRSPDAPP